MGSSIEAHPAQGDSAPINTMMEAAMTVGCFGNHAEDRYHARQLDRFLAEQDAAEQRAARVEERAKDLMQPGEDYYPWTFENFEEAIGNAPDAQRKMLFACVSEAVDAGLQNDHANHLALVALRQLNERYWTEVAAKCADAEEA